MMGLLVGDHRRAFARLHDARAMDSQLAPSLAGDRSVPRAGLRVCPQLIFARCSL
jgi:hypothetical protein